MPFPSPMSATPQKYHNLKGQSLLFHCLDTGFVTTSPALTRFQQGRKIDPSLRELVGERPATGSKKCPQRSVSTAGTKIAIRINYVSITSSRSSIPQSSTVMILDAKSNDSAAAAFSSVLARRAMVVAAKVLHPSPKDAMPNYADSAKSAP